MVRANVFLINVFIVEMHICAVFSLQLHKEVNKRRE